MALNETRKPIANHKPTFTSRFAVLAAAAAAIAVLGFRSGERAK